MASGPLATLRVLEIASRGPGPFAAMLLADMGADVLRIDRPDPVNSEPPPEFDVLNRGRRSAMIDLKKSAGVATLLRLVERADVLMEGFRPGVAERLGFGPDVCAGRNPRLVFGRVTGWGQDGPYAAMAGHDIDYIALTGVLSAIGGTGSAPVPPLNLVGDYAGGAIFAFGLLCAVLEARDSGRGQIVDTAMVDTTSLLAAHVHALIAAGRWRSERGTNLLDGGAPFYSVYETVDGRFMAVGALEEKFYDELVRRLGLRDLPPRGDRANWPALRQRFATAFGARTQREWTAIFDGSDACVAPILSFDEAAAHPHNVARGTFTEFASVRQPAPAPRLSRTPTRVRSAPPLPGQHTSEVLADWGYAPGEIDDLRRAGAIR